MFNNETDKDAITFLYLFCNENYFTRTEGDTSGTNGSSHTRVWWKMPDGEWAVFPNLFNKNDTNIVNFIKKSIGDKELVYCMYNNYLYNGFIYSAKDDYKYYNSYNIPLTYTITYKVVDGTNINNLITSNS